MNNEPLGDIVARRLQQRGLGPATQAAYLCALANQVSDGRYEATTFRHQTLTIVPINAIIAVELRFELPQLTERLRQKLHLSPDVPFYVRIKHKLV